MYYTDQDIVDAAEMMAPTYREAKREAELETLRKAFANWRKWYRELVARYPGKIADEMAADWKQTMVTMTEKDATPEQYVDAAQNVYEYWEDRIDDWISD